MVGIQHWSAGSRSVKRVVALAVAALLASLLVATVGSGPATAALPEDLAMVRLVGGGWGHGVGMSQYGAYGRGAAGHSRVDILDFYYPGSDLTDVGPLDDVRVHLFSGSGAVFTTTGPVDLRNADDDVFVTLAAATTLTIDRVTSGFTITTPDNTNVCLQPGESSGDDDPPIINHCAEGTVRVPTVSGQPIKTDVVGQLSVGTPGNRYQWGTLTIGERFDTTDTLWVVLEDMTMQQYLYGLAEVPASWPAATLEAQAIAGRTYAYDRITARRSSTSWTVPWDLYSTVNDQHYSGYGNEIGTFAPNWKAAVDASAQEVLLHQGDPISAFYTSSNGGMTADSGHVFVTSLPYLPAQVDSFDAHKNPYASWTRDYTGAELNQWFSNSAIKSVGTLLDIYVDGEPSPSGRLDKTSITIVGTDRTVQTNGTQLRIAINSGVHSAGGGFSREVRSTRYTIEVIGDEPVGALDAVTRSGNTIEAVGWAFDPDDGASVPIELRVDGATIYEGTADGARFDVGVAVREGEARGYVLGGSVSAGAHQVCVYAANLGGGPTLLLGCEVV